MQCGGSETKPALSSKLKFNTDTLAVVKKRQRQLKWCYRATRDCWRRRRSSWCESALKSPSNRVGPRPTPISVAVRHHLWWATKALPCFSDHFLVDPGTDTKMQFVHPNLTQRTHLNVQERHASSPQYFCSHPLLHEHPALVATCMLYQRRQSRRWRRAHSMKILSVENIVHRLDRSTWDARWPIDINDSVSPSPD